MGATVTAPTTEERLVEGASFVEATRDSIKRTVELDLIVEGFGNARDNHYYSADLLQRELIKFSGALMFSNHLTAAQEAQLEGQPRPWEHLIGRILPGSEHIAVNESGKKVVRGTALISNPLAWQYIEADPEILKVSINARGASRTGMAEGRNAKIVEGINVVRSVDVVSQAGAGGKINKITEAFMESASAAVQDEEDSMDTVEEGKKTCADCDAELEGGKCPECDVREGDDVEPDAPDTDDAEDETADDADGEEAEGDDVEESDDDLTIEDEDIEDVEEGEWTPVEESGDDEPEADESDDEDDEDDAAEEAEVTEGRRGGRRGEASSGRDRTPVSAEFGMDKWSDRDEHEIDAPYQDPDKHDPYEKAKAHVGRPAKAAQLAAQIEAEIESRVEAQLEAELAAVEASYIEAMEEMVDDHTRALEQLEQRYVAREQIKESDLPDASKAALIAQFHDFYAENRSEGDEVVAEAREVLSEAVAKAIDAKNAELNDFAEARVEGAGESAGADTGAGDRSTPLRESGERPKQAPLDEQLDQALGIAGDQV